MKANATNNNFKPIYAHHPGITLRDKLEEMQMSVKEFALRTTKPEKTINAVLSGESSLTPDMAIAFEQITLIPAHFWLNLQRNHDEYIARQKREAICNDAETMAWAKCFPYAEMANLNWVPSTRNISEKVSNLFSFFKITSVKAWEDYYLRQELKSIFSISLSTVKNPYAMSAWLRRGEIVAESVNTQKTYSDSLLKEKIPQLLFIVETQPSDFALQISKICSEAGVKIIGTEQITQAKTDGCTRWINNSPCIQLTNERKDNDIFWTSFFHELGHILLHGKKDVFIEGAEGNLLNEEKEVEADQFASEKLLSGKLEAAIIKDLQSFQPSQKIIKEEAKQCQTHPAIIVGRLQKKGILSKESTFNELKIPISFKTK